MKKTMKKAFTPVSLNRPLQSVMPDPESVEMEDYARCCPHPGDEWTEAQCYQSELEKARTGAPEGAYAPDRRRIFEIYYILEKLRKETARMRRQFSIRTQNPAKSLTQLVPLPRRDHFVRGHLENISREIEICGRTLILGWLNEDQEFFTGLSRICQIAFGRRRKHTDESPLGDMTLYEFGIQTAVKLWYDEKQNPKRETVIMALEANGVNIRPKDQAMFFKRCHLDFLQSSKGRGRPRKIPHPV